MISPGVLRCLATPCSPFNDSGSILVLVLPSGGMAAKHQEDTIAVRYNNDLCINTSPKLRER
ncbi:hypothetical protein T265_06788 [Opisthorchis viverrini]|uniref:Uncharacterized protein n=1 Tax=Opisthorchis viverrini TaxID=6198 RepID=A0A074ZET7_OPIVI|nr:hypothetical protein T265_06788 [Opisthorchis viverrini]KER25811.1 hypothetical protein T265_06788 [Opisthorchis viverrini]